MNEHQIDDALRAALDVDHSPEFQARVRASIAGEPEPPVWQAVWPSLARGGAVAIGAAGLVMVIAVMRDTPVIERDDASGRQAATASVGLNRTADIAVLESAPPVAEQVASRVPAAPSSVESPSTEGQPLPGVIVSADDGRTLVLLARHVQAGFALPPAPVAGEVAVEPLPALSRIEVPPMAVIEPLAIARLGEGDLQ